MADRLRSVNNWMAEHQMLGFLILAVGIAVALGLGYQAQRDANDSSAASDARFDRIASISCADRRHAWDALNEVILNSTAPLEVPAGLASNPDERARYQLSNQRRELQRTRELEKLGPRPTCGL